MKTYSDKSIDNVLYMLSEIESDLNNIPEQYQYYIEDNINKIIDILEDETIKNRVTA